MHRSQLAVVIVILIHATACLNLQAAGKMVEITLDGARRTGTVIRHQGATGWFMERDGRLETIELTAVTDYQPRGSFRAYSAVELRERLAREFGRDYTVTSSGHYLVVSSRGVTGRYASPFEDLYRQFVVTFAARGFRMREPEFPLVAVVLPSQARFAEYCRTEGVQPRHGLRGYYLPTSNRVALYDAAAEGQTTATGLDDTIIHEAVHQVAFNTGIHSRIGENPKWVVEGLATAFEASAVRANDRTSAPVTRVNLERYRWYRQQRERGSSMSLGGLIASDDVFSSSTLDAYAEAWALTFYLLETRSADYSAYLRRLAERNPLEEYPSAERLADFQRFFGRDLSLLESRMRRFFDEIAATE